MEKPFRIKYKDSIFNFELETKSGTVWLIKENEIPSKTNFGQVKPAQNINEAKEIAELMLQALGY